VEEHAEAGQLWSSDVPRANCLLVLGLAAVVDLDRSFGLVEGHVEVVVEVRAKKDEYQGMGQPIRSRYAWILR
jgi:hypothetical protein